jgi:EAL domain-containing protein (putative c-di-GMP-specific phosphodiesterase class I)
MYRAKESGRNTFRFFTTDLDVEAVKRLRLENQLQHAAQRGEFELVYQPRMEIATGVITGLEALIRWRNPELGDVEPSLFIPIAENSGLILPIGEWVLKTACAQTSRWQMQGLSPVPVAVNVSAVQFRQDGFAERIEQLLCDTGLPAAYLELELTETILLSNADLMCTVLQKLLQMGVKIAIDDFGTGYSSLSYLKQFRATRLKIDRSFIRDLTTDCEDAAITAAIIGMGRTLNLTVVAEGVETAEQMSILRDYRCDEVQGFYFSKPLPAAQVAELLGKVHPQIVLTPMGTQAAD